ncbi:hypothetical protein [Desulfobacterium sp. N47]|uniref:hypothetical protein n=1 Tax=Desulfobacterium sp. N47 TaxID=3115210 RepID=UPI003F4A8410
MTPLITSANRSGQWRRNHLFSAHSQSLNAIVITVVAEKQPLTLSVLNLTAENFAVLRHIALNMIKKGPTPKKSVKSKRLRAGWDNYYLMKVLAG